MKRMKRNIRMAAVLLAVMLAVSMAAGVCASAAEEYEPLTVKLPYRHLYTTNDKAVDALFHYIIESQTDGGALPAEADANGVFTFQGNDGTGVASGKNTVYDLQGELTFTFNKPGEYVYKVYADLATDNQKTHAERYTFEPRQYTVYFYIANETNGSLRLRMLTAQDDSGIKENNVELDPAYKGPEQDTTPRTGDGTPVGVYTAMMLGSTVMLLLVGAAVLRKKAKRG